MTYWAPIKRLTVSNAGHPRPLLYRAALRKWYPIDIDKKSSCAQPCSNADRDNLPLGIHKPATYGECSLERGDA